MTRHDTQNLLAEHGFLPARSTVYSDKTLQTRYSIFAILPDILNNAVARPSTVTRRRYQEVSETIQKVLQTEDRPAQDIIQIVADEVREVKNGT
jgi:ABC-type glycerol-3-phosphate transport system substrate-binding protein